MCIVWVTHDRDINDAQNLHRLATETALPVATRSEILRLVRTGYQDVPFCGSRTATGPSCLSETKRDPLAIGWGFGAGSNHKIDSRAVLSMRAMKSPVLDTRWEFCDRPRYVSVDAPGRHT